MRMKYLTLLAPLAIAVAAHATAVVAATPRGTYEVEIVAPEMCCKGCAQKVAGQLYAAPGVTNVEADLENKKVAVTISRQKGASLEQLWQAVEAGEGGPTSLSTTEATFTMTRPEAIVGQGLPQQGTTYVVIDNLHCKGCAQKIAAQLYTIRGVNKVSANMKQNTLTIKSKGQGLSHWALVGAVRRAKERPVAILGVGGRMDIAWSAPKATNSHQASSQSQNRKVQR